MTEGGLAAGSGVRMSPRVQMSRSSCWLLTQRPRPMAFFTQAMLVRYLNPHVRATLRASSKCGAVAYKNSTASRVALR
jgi:hypothetical protein